MARKYSNKEEHISVSDFEKRHDSIDEYEDRYDLLEDVKDCLVEYKDYSWDTLGDNTDFEIKDGVIIVDVEVYH